MGSKSRGAVWATALGIALFQVIGSFGAADNQPERKAVDALALILILAGPAALAVRDRWPLAAAAVAIAAADAYVALGYPYGPIFVSVAVGLFVAVQAGRSRATWALAAAGYVGFIAAHLVDPRAGSAGLLHLALVAGWLVVVLAVSEVVRTRRDQSAQRQRTEADERQRRVDEERLRLAQDLHDVLAHNISLINVQASVALHLLDDDPEQARPALATIKDVSKDALHELRTALDLLRRGAGDEAPRSPTPRLADLDALVAGVRAGGLDVRLEQRDTPPPLPAPVESAVYRIVQEALTNVTRHAHASTVTVRLGYDEGVTIEVTDDGRGGPAEPGNGIRGMKERAAALGGTADAGPVPGTDGGFRVTARLPLPPP
ncbi:MAG: hypothetical protein QOG82_803 [Actinomycetota bacterium]|jgi:signal transduction histidine kinase|nr:hypothetical protein [Actinomycetota bacterium]